jgi:hypothetical protein
VSRGRPFSFFTYATKNYLQDKLAHTYGMGKGTMRMCFEFEVGLFFLFFMYPTNNYLQTDKLAHMERER